MLRYSILVMTIASSLLSREAVAQGEWRCFRLTYPGTPSTDLVVFPARLAMQGTGPFGPLVSKPHASDSIGFWRMFQNVESQWQVEKGDSISAHFTNHFTNVELRVGPGAVSRSGHAVVRFDFGDPSQHPRSTVNATLEPCFATDTIGPERDPVALAERAYSLQQVRLERAEFERLRSAPSPVRGLYRLEISVSGRQPTIAYLRTVSRASEPIWLLDSHWNYTPDSLQPDSRAQGYRLQGAVALDSTQLPDAALLTDRDDAAIAGLTVAASPDSVASGPHRWRASTDVVMALSRLTTGQPSHDAFLEASQEVSHIWYDGQEGETIGWLSSSAEGEVRLDMIVSRGQTVLLQVHGKRIDDGVLRDR